jgi:hypothetical protein
MGVQRPRMRSAEQPAASNCRVVENVRVGAIGPWMNCTRGVADTARRSIKPVPGQPSGKVEKSLCISGPAFRLQIVKRNRKPK